MGKKGCTFNSRRKVDLPEFLFGSRSGVIASFFSNGLTANLFKKDLIEKTLETA